MKTKAERKPRKMKFAHVAEYFQGYDIELAGFGGQRKDASAHPPAGANNYELD